MKTLIPSVKGARDFYPAEKAIHGWLYEKIGAISSQFGYEEYDGPFLEKIDLYAAKSGEELVKEQAFVMQDRGGELLTLRPELTPSLARMVAQRQNQLTYPLRWWSFGPFWRYERPQKGRSREFFQWNIDMIGVSSPEADAELIAICIEFLRSVGLTAKQVGIRVNDRRLMDEALSEIGISGEMKKSAFRLIDRSDKLPIKEWENYALELGFTQKQLNGLKAILQDTELWKRSESLQRLFIALKALSVEEFVEFDAHIIRGLDYYTGTVFEANDLDGGRAILGGGHYDNLVEAVGGEPLPGVGFAMGDVMITLVLEKYGLLPELKPFKKTCLVAVFDENALSPAFGLAAKLRAAGLNALCYPTVAKLIKQFKYADKLGVRYVILQGPDELNEGKVAIKDLTNSQQQSVSEARLVETMQKLLE
jgi:histidyl-tRNA synthetase